MALTAHNHTIIQSHFSNKNKKIAIDATCGNGHDTEFLCQLGFKQVFGFDIQTQAISNTEQRLKRKKLNANLILAGHETMNSHIPTIENVDCVMFNFGYLPSADKNITTKSTTSIQALENATNLLSNNGLITLMCYPGHPEGALETKTIESWLNNLNTTWQVDTHLSKSPKPTAPILFTIKHQKS